MACSERSGTPVPVPPAERGMAMRAERRNEAPAARWKVSRGRFATLDSGSQHGNDSGTACQFSLTDFSSGLWQPADGDWRRYTLTFTTNANIVGDIGVRFNVFPQQSAENGALVHLDLPGPAPDLQSVPEPALLAMIGFGLAALGARLRASRRTS